VSNNVQFISGLYVTSHVRHDTPQSASVKVDIAILLLSRLVMGGIRNLTKKSEHNFVYAVSDYEKARRIEQ